MALQTSIIDEAVNDFQQLLPEILTVIKERGANAGHDITTVEDFADALVNSAAKLGVPFAATAQMAIPLAHSLFGALATYIQGKTAAPAAPAA